MRQRRYVVTDVLPSALPAPQPGSISASQHLFMVNSIEDDAARESIRGIWEVDPVSTAARHDKVRQFVDAVRDVLFEAVISV